uniref:Annexin n=1 Tax=Schistosoma japonicum TaxID=6182 RepID=Q5DHI5_SCHJA|nr:SJCHGC01577 protein [Schistosoma japonicum]CAX72687.1 Annexin A13 (Annexin XIII) (Annexin, intestine-specific) [Schistosoma japonicum]CAX82892.1 Annexin A13 (Annexin XIII) (Annexin, intestine-specific) [Schistosoma japonicum]
MISHQAGPSITYPDRISAESDAEQLHNACKGLSTDEETITKILGHRSQYQRHQIREAFQRRYRKDLVHVLCGATKGDYHSLIKTLFRGKLQILAYDLYKGIKKPEIINEIICCCNNKEIEKLKIAYEEVLREEDPKKASQRTLETDIIKETKPPYEQLLVALLKANRDEDSPELVDEAIRTRNTSRLVNRIQVDKDVEELYYAGEKRAGKGDADTFIRILTKRSQYHVKEIMDVYYSRYDHTLVDAVKNKFSEPFRTGLNTMIMALKDLRLLLVCQLYDSMYGLGTREDTLIRIVCLRCEVDMNTLKSMYREYFGKPLIEAVREDTSGDFRKLLLALMGE